MEYDTKEKIEMILQSISTMEQVQSIGISGDISSFPKPGEGDIDVFIYCTALPERESRQRALLKAGGVLQDIKINVFEGGHWGTGDFALINGIETWLMYFTETEVMKDAEAILRGDYPDKSGNYYYPVGRLAMLKSINIIYDKEDFLSALKEKLSYYPNELSRIIIRHHMEKLKDTEDLDRAVTRKDVLFYHYAIDIAVDHFLQALFALNRIYFPSRKRSLEYIKRFTQKPERCEEHLLEVIHLGSYAEGIEKSYQAWNRMIIEMERLTSERY